nr:unnamed protein product [Callosobruchus chinensis]
MNETDSYALLVRKRAAIKAKQTTFKKFVDNFKASVKDGSLEGLSKSKMNDLELRVERHEKVLNEFEEIQAQIEVVCEDLDSQMIEREEFDNVYFSLLASCKAMISEYYDANQQSIKASRTNTQINESKCIFCKRSGHYIQNCHEFLKLSHPDKLKQLDSNGICSNCLRGQHPVRKCMAGSCKKCHKRHNTLLHQNVEKSNATNNASTSESFSGSSNIVSTSACHILLSTAIVHVKDVSGSFQQCRVLLDSGSQSNFITETACKRLGLKTDPLELAVIGINQVSSHIKKSCKVYLESMHTSYFTVATCLVLPSINDYLPSQNIDTSSLNIPKHLNLADPSYFTSSGVDMLLGAEFFYELLCIGQIRLGKNLPTLQKTVLGWVLSGPIPFVQPLQQTTCHLTTNQEIHHLLTKFWEIEEPLVTKDLQFSSEEQICEDIFQATTKRASDGRFIVQIHLKMDPSHLGNSRETAIRRLRSIESKLSKDTELRLQYEAFLKTYQSMGHMEDIPSSNVPQNSHFLPHHAVINENNKTTRLRVVFDASARTDNDVSFNDLQYVGPTIQDNLFSILLRFRQGSIAIAADIVKMYRQIQSISLNGTFRFELQKWASNSEAVLQYVKSQNPSAVINIGNDQRSKTLGIYWSCYTDDLMYSIKEPPSGLQTITKRSILSDIAQVFDPLGLLGPCIIIGKILLQQLWLQNLHWDESLPSSIDSRWRQLRRELPLLNTVQIPRHVTCPSPVQVELHGFTDASTEAYGACLYLRSVSSSGELTVRLLTAKSKVSPLKSLTIPKLELCGALLLAQLTTKVKQSMNITLNKIFLWCDSTVCLAWIHTEPNRLQVFVQNRVAQIQAQTSPKNWHYIRTDENPADLLSRGVYPSILANSHLWWSGPGWLEQDESYWPTFTWSCEGEIPELRKRQMCLASSQKISLINMSTYSSLTKLQRVVAYVFRFISNSRTQPQKLLCPLSSSELSAALTYLQRTKWKTRQSSIQIGSLVIIREDHLPPLQWKIGRVTKLHPGPDGLVRVATIRTSQGEVKRSFARFCVLPIEPSSSCGLSLTF